MNDYDVSTETITCRIHEAERMRAEAVRELLIAWGGQVRRWLSSLGKFARSLPQRGGWKVSLPAPHH